MISKKYTSARHRSADCPRRRCGVAAGGWAIMQGVITGKAFSAGATESVTARREFIGLTFRYKTRS